jgi:ABC-type lipoprotein release transport system permease subunit
MIPVQIRVAFFLALRQIKRANKSTTLLIVFIMTLTFLNLVVVNGILVGLIRGSYEQFRERYSGDILISPQDRLESIESSQSIINFAKGLNGIEAVAPRLVATGAIRADLSRNPSGKESPNESRGSIVGIDPESEELVTGFSEREESLR